MEVVNDRILFGVMAAVAVGGAVGVGLARQPLRAALALMAHLLGMAGLFLLLAAPLVAVAQVLVYAGAVMVLFVFVIMMLGWGNGGRAQGPLPRGQRVVVGLAALGGAVLAGVIAAAVQSSRVSTAGGPEGPPLQPATQMVARALLVDYLVPFEVVSVLLLAVMVGVVALARES